MNGKRVSHAEGPIVNGGLRWPGSIFRLIKTGNLPQTDGSLALRSLRTINAMSRIGQLWEA